MMDSQWEGMLKYLMDENFVALFNYSGSSPDHPYLPNVSKPVYILGCKYDSKDDREEIAHHLKSRLWMTYRKGFSPIGSRNGPKSDAGWGCMHRCGQMVLAEAMLRFHLGKSWKWSNEQENPEYYRILQMFQDRRSALYSIQTITLTGVSVGKSIGSWFGPNTVAQVIKKLSVYDRWTNLFVHISVEDGIIIDEIKSLCCQRRSYFNFNNDLSQNENKNEPNDSTIHNSNENAIDAGEESDSSTSSFSCPFVQNISELNQSCDWNKEALQKCNYDTDLVDLQSQLQLPVTREVDDSCIEIVLPPTFTNSTCTNQVNEATLSSTNCEVNKTSPYFDNSTNNQSDENSQIGKNEENQQGNSGDNNDSNAVTQHEPLSSTLTSPPSNWRPLLLFVPLRLGLHNPNPCYFNAIKAVFRVPYCIGILGGSPCHAVWIVGVVGDDVICLDPHTTQPAGRGNLKSEYDQTYHCENPIRMPLKRLDPSMVLGFLCSTEKEFDDLINNLKEEVLHPSVASSWPLVEIHATRPANLPPLPSSSNPSNDLLISVYTADNAIGDCGIDKKNDTTGKDQTSTDVECESKLSEAVGAVKTLWSKCNQMAGDTVRSLASVPQRLVKGSEYEVV